MTDHETDLTLHASELDGVTVVTATGEVDSSNCASLQEVLASLGRPGAGRDVHVDLAGVSFMDSSGLRALIVGQRLITEAGGSFRVMAVSDSLRRLLDITGLAGPFGLTT